MQKNIIWISSYPKSGNTWMRSILTGLIYTNDGNFDFDLLPKIDQFEKDENFKFIKKISENDYKNLNKLENISKYWQLSQENIKQKECIFFKTHSANYKHNNIRFTNINKTLGAIYIVRDPRDVAISYSKFIGKSIDETITYMTESKRQIYTLGIILSRWDYHLASWINADFPILILRYEDLLEKSKGTLEQIIKFLKEDMKVDFRCNDAKIENILTSTSFKSLKDKERIGGFREASKNEYFFRSGESNQWKNMLTSDQISIIEYNFSTYMKKFNYI